MKKCLIMLLAGFSMTYNTSIKPMDVGKQEKTKKDLRVIIAEPRFTMRPGPFMNRCGKAIIAIKKNMTFLKNDSKLKFAANISLNTMRSRLLGDMLPKINPKEQRNFLNRIDELSGLLNDEQPNSHISSFTLEPGSLVCRQLFNDGDDLQNSTK